MIPRGTIVAGYRIDGVLGEGGMGTVYRATQLSLNRVVALKLLAGELSNDSGFRARFKREGQLQAQLDHSHIVTVYEAGQSEHGLFLAMRLIDGPTLKDLIRSSKLDPRRSIRLLAQVAQALDEAHEAGLIHRDIKPQNILIGKGDHAYLADFGLIKAPDDAEGLTGTGQFVGTIDYVTPEQIQGEPATAATDCYALAAVLCECLTGEVPFPRATEAATLHAHIIESPPRLTERRPELPAAIDDVIAAGMAKDPAARPSSVELIRRAAGAFAGPARMTPDTQETRLAGPPRFADDDQRTGRADELQAVRGDEASPGRGDGRDNGERADRRADSPSRLSTVETSQATPAVGVAARAAAARPAPSPSPRGTPGSRSETDRLDAGRRRSGVRPLTAVAIVAVAAVAIVAGLVVGNSGSSAGPAPFTNIATNGHLELRYPSGWQPSSDAPAVPGMSFVGAPIILARTTGGGALRAGEIADASGPTLLSPSFRSQLVGSLPAAEPVTLNGVQAYRYSGLQLRGIDGTVTVYAVPTSAGVATIVCGALSHAPAAVLTDCSQIAATLQLVDTSAYPLTPNAAYANKLTTTFDRLDATVKAPLAALGAATTPSAQASAAQQLAGAYTQAANALAGATVSPQLQDANAAIVTALHQLAGGYTGAAAAARASSSAAYRRAGAQIAAASTALHTALQSLAALGYSVGH